MKHALLLTLLVLLLLTGCTKKKYPPQLTSVSPSSAPIGADITLAGAQFGDAPTVMIGSQTVTTKSHTDNSITLTIPRMATGPTTIRVQNPDGSSDPLPFTVLQPQPQLTSVDPANGLPGTLVKLTGDFLDKLKTVRFGTAQAEISGSASEKELSVKVPAVSRGPVKITLETEGGQGQTDFIVANTPLITGFAPAKIKVGDELTITGSNLLDGVVSLNGAVVDKTQTQVQDTQIKVKMPQTASSGTLKVTVFDKLVATSSQSLEVVPPPVISNGGLSSTEGIKGDKITITGQNLAEVSAVSFGGTSAMVKVISATQIETTVPERTTSGEVEVTITSLGGSFVASQKFLLILPPADLIIDPLRRARGKDITIQGKNLHRITSVNVGDKVAVITSRTEGSEVKATLPADAVDGKISVSNRAGSVVSSQSLRVILKPIVTSFTTKATLGKRVMLKGDYLQDARVFFANSKAGADYDGKNTDTEVWLTVPADAQDGPIRVWNESGEYVDTGLFNVLRLPVVSDFTPKEGKRGQEVAISGQYLGDVTEVRFSNGQSSPAPNRRVESGVLKVTVPDDAQDGALVLTAEAGKVSTDKSFNVLQPPTLSGISPDKGVVGTEVTLLGSNLSGVQEVKFGDRVAVVKSGDNGKVVVSCPDFGSVQGVQVTVRTSGGTSNGQGFTGAPQAEIDQTPVPNGLISGGPLTLRGKNMSNVTSIQFLTNNEEVTETVSKDKFLDSEPGTILVKVPIGTPAGKVRINNEYGTGKARSIGSLNSNDPLTTGNVATSVSTITNTIITDADCRPNAFFYCASNSPVVMGFSRDSKDENCNLFRNYLTKESNGGKLYEVLRSNYFYTITKDSYAELQLKLERNSQDNGYTGPVIVALKRNGSTTYYVGNMTQNLDIYTYSLTDGSLFKMCRQNSPPPPGRPEDYFKTSCDCK